MAEIWLVDFRAFLLGTGFFALLYSGPDVLCLVGGGFGIERVLIDSLLALNGDDLAILSLAASGVVEMQLSRASPTLDSFARGVKYAGAPAVDLGQDGRPQEWQN